MKASAVLDRVVASVRALALAVVALPLAGCTLGVDCGYGWNAQWREPGLWDALGAAAEAGKLSVTSSTPPPGLPFDPLPLGRDAENLTLRALKWAPNGVRSAASPVVELSGDGGDGGDGWRVRVSLDGEVDEARVLDLFSRFLARVGLSDAPSRAEWERDLLDSRDVRSWQEGPGGLSPAGYVHETTLDALPNATRAGFEALSESLSREVRDSTGRRSVVGHAWEFQFEAPVRSATLVTGEGEPIDVVVDSIGNARASVRVAGASADEEGRARVSEAAERAGLGALSFAGLETSVVTC